MTDFTIDVDDETMHWLRILAGAHGRSLEDEVREILIAAMAKAPNEEDGSL